jgi:hypothetical protein
VTQWGAHQADQPTVGLRRNDDMVTGEFPAHDVKTQAVVAAGEDADAGEARVRSIPAADLLRREGWDSSQGPAEPARLAPRRVLGVSAGVLAIVSAFTAASQYLSQQPNTGPGVVAAPVAEAAAVPSTTATPPATVDPAAIDSVAVVDTNPPPAPLPPKPAPRVQQPKPPQPAPPPAKPKPAPYDAVMQPAMTMIDAFKGFWGG